MNPSARTMTLPQRSERLARLAGERFEVLVIGGGITGAGIALDLALRGVRTALVERGDWAGSTSSTSSRLVHGGLRYLEQFEFGLVRESCLERAQLLDNAAGLVWPERFVFPVHRGDRVGLWKMQLGMWLYTALSVPRALGIPGRLSRDATQLAIPGLRAEGLRGSGTYLDAATDDARLTLAILRAASVAGAVCVSRCEVLAVEQGASGAAATLRDVAAAAEPGASPAAAFELELQAVVLAAGPSTDALRARCGLSGRAWLQPTRGSHVVVAREALPTDGAVIFPSGVDGRVMFLIPWPRQTVIGTTDIDDGQEVGESHDGSSGPRATRAEVRYLLDSANALVPDAGLGEQHVQSTWSGLRPLLDAVGEDPSQRSREERIEQQGRLWTIAGGKLTGYRAMAEHLCARLCRAHALGTDRGRRSPTLDRRLPGALSARAARPLWSRLNGRRGADDRTQLEIAWAKRYAADAVAVRAFVSEHDGRAEPLGPDTVAGELDWSAQHEDVLSLADFCFRRTDLGYEPTAARAALSVLADRLGDCLAWSPARRTAERQALERELAHREAWRADPA